MRNYLYNLAYDKSQGFIAAIIKFFLFIFSLIYGLAIRILIFLTPLWPCRLNCRVISVGNITLGGTGKTSLVEYVAGSLKAQGKRVAILSRGYGRNSRSAADEPAMLKANLGNVPVIIDADRIRAARSAIRDWGIDTVILDDGFQQWKIKKDLEIVTIDATNPFGNRQMIPRGILREPLSSLERADIFILTKTNFVSDFRVLEDFLRKINPCAEIYASQHKARAFYPAASPQTLLSPQGLRGQTVILFCGIGDPDSFESLVKSLGIKVGRFFRFPDHYQYTQKDLEGIFVQAKKQNIDRVITTEKDAMRIFNLSPITYHLSPFLVLRISLEITDEERFNLRLLKLYRA